jgi:MFS transporter, SP family, sugar:H+ symporter
MVDQGPGNASLGAKVFFVWGTCCFFCALFVYFFVYETKGMTLEQVDELYETVGSARKSSAFVPSAKFSRDNQEKIDGEVTLSHVEGKFEV